MKITVSEDSGQQDIEVIICCQKTDERVKRIVSKLSTFDKKLNVTKNGQISLLPIQEILYIDTVDKHTFLYTSHEVYESQYKLYELEERLSGYDYFRATKSSIINFNQMTYLKPEFGGRMLVTMSNNEKLYISRQYVPIIKEKLGIES